jgi:hypothetical protein
MDDEGKRVRRTTRFSGDFSKFDGPENSSDDDDRDPDEPKKIKVIRNRDIEIDMNIYVYAYVRFSCFDMALCMA